MRYPTRLPRIETPPPSPASHRALWFSASVHLIALLMLLWRPGLVIDTGEDPGPVGPRGGGGGGGRQVTFVALPPLPMGAVVSDRPEVDPPTTRIPVTRQVVRTVRDMPDRPQQLRTVRTVPLARAVGIGPGTGGGAGAGTGSGGGVGSGEGTGVGSGRGPGVGGVGGDVFPPTVRFTYLPPLPVPDELKGRHFRVHFVVGPDGRVADVSVAPAMENGGYQRRFLDVMRRFRFNPAVGADGAAVSGEAVLGFTL